MSLQVLATVVPDVASASVATVFGLLAWRWRRASRLAHRRAAQLRAARDEHERHSAFLSAVLDELPGRILISDARGAVQFANYNRNEGTLDDLFELDGETPVDPERRPLARALSGERVADVELIAHGRDGAHRRLLINAAPVLEPSGRLLGAVRAATDITERREAELRLAEVNLVLRAVRDATHDLPEDGDVAQAICEATRMASGAGLVVLFQPDGEGGLVTTGAVGYDGALPVRVALDDPEPPGTVQAFLSGEPIFASDARAHPGVSQSWVRERGLTSAIIQPVGDAAGVLVVGWRDAVGDLSEPAAMSIRLLADEAALALERADLIAQLRDLSLTDPLTGLPNRRAWDAEMERERSRAARQGYPLCVALLDLDRFKAYNDEFGHPAGDWLLRAASSAWPGALRDTDTLARWGGEEFAVCLPNCAPDEAEAVLARLRALIPDGQTCSVGMAAWDGAESAAELLARADRALYDAKHAGRDRLVVAG